MNFHKENVERWLDEALAEYGKAEPRTGLEARMLARLSAEQSRSRRRLWWRIFALGTVALMAFAFAWTVHLGRKQVSESPVAKGSVRAPDRGTNHDHHRLEESDRHMPSGSRKRGKPARLEQFPSPTPLTDQEKMLALYVRDFPEKAALVARAQAELHRQDELEMAAPWPAPKGGAQQE